jgi:hypothetical protein
MRIITLRTTKKIKLVRQGLENLRAEIPKVAKSRMWAAMLLIRRKLFYTQTRPPRRPKQKYIRTFTLMRGYRIGKSSPTSYFFKSTAPYTVYVIGGARGEGQATIHSGRWPLMRDVVEWVMARLPKSVAQGIRLVSRKSFR